MFEKSLYDFIRGLRGSKENAEIYIQNSLKECRKEIIGSDMSIKANALLKLVYLEMMGYDMSWASFHVLEVMSSQSFLQKRIGYITAVQTFRTDTEVLMLAENLLKKDLNSTNNLNISLALTAIPHIISFNMSNSLLNDLLPRLNHSNVNVRKKSIITLYRLALVNPDTLRLSWPRIKERLLDVEENAAVTACIIHVICELSWRRPKDFLPLAPRLFDLFIQGENNWMSIKVIKLFSTLIPLEPRLIKKILPYMITIVKTTNAMSLLYECINGFIESGILKSLENSFEGEELLKLCVNKLYGMLLIQNDSNLTFVSLLTFEKLVKLYPDSVSLHQDVILNCIDHGDITIRMRVLNLIGDMINSENLTIIINKLVNQLQSSLSEDDKKTKDKDDKSDHDQQSDDEFDGEVVLVEDDMIQKEFIPLPDDYRAMVIRKILFICSKDTYSNLVDFEWYLSILIQLVKVCPLVPHDENTDFDYNSNSIVQDCTYLIGEELRNIAVRVREMRQEVVKTSSSFILLENKDKLYSKFSTNNDKGILISCSWIVGEYSKDLINKTSVLNSLIDSTTYKLSSNHINNYLQAILKIFSNIVNDIDYKNNNKWSKQQKIEVELLISRIIYFLEPLLKHSNLDLQEISAEYYELLKLMLESLSSLKFEENDDFINPPLLLTTVLPSLHNGQELKPIAPNAQYKIRLPDDLDLESPINSNLESILREADSEDVIVDNNNFDSLYYPQDEDTNQEHDLNETAFEKLDRVTNSSSDYYSYHDLDDASSNLSSSKNDKALIRRLKVERDKRNKDDPFYIPDGSLSVSEKLDNIIQSSNGESIDIDSIPIMKLDLGNDNDNMESISNDRPEEHNLSESKDSDYHIKLNTRKTFKITEDETLDDFGNGNRSGFNSVRSNSPKRKVLLGMSSAGLGNVNLNDDESFRLDNQQREEEEKALKDVEKLRLEMQRAKERIESKEGEVVVKRKKKKSKNIEPDKNDGEMESANQQSNNSNLKDNELTSQKKKKKKKKAVINDDDDDDQIDSIDKNALETTSSKVKKKKRRQVNLIEPTKEDEA